MPPTLRKPGQLAFAPVQPMVGVAVIAAFVLLGMHWFGSTWWLVAIYVVAGLVCGSLLSVAAHYNPVIGIVILAACIGIVFYLGPRP